MRAKPDIAWLFAAPMGTASDLGKVLDCYFAVPGIKLENTEALPDPLEPGKTFFIQMYSVGNAEGFLGALYVELHNVGNHRQTRAWHVHNSVVLELNLKASRYGEKKRRLLELLLGTIDSNIISWAFTYTEPT